MVGMPLTVTDVEERGGDNTIEVLGIISTLTEEEGAYFWKVLLGNLADDTQSPSVGVFLELRRAQAHTLADSFLSRGMEVSPHKETRESVQRRLVDRGDPSLLAGILLEQRMVHC